MKKTALLPALSLAFALALAGCSEIETEYLSSQVEPILQEQFPNARSLEVVEINSRGCGVVAFLAPDGMPMRLRFHTEVYDGEREVHVVGETYFQRHEGEYSGAQVVQNNCGI